ncbi:quinone oxidoreductase [Ruegeria litorea]|uniref:Quinone oxidoreductase n=1 Tax=Falsiruegeria litorea TaxID=1280831 RepID=A0ABS5WK42_9RHOB|nr:quinone oxidoreductase [Falsiruegeria litorea]MBT3139489.1 quinone oxidoreductase [Falsiruegeria litorea]
MSQAIVVRNFGNAEVLQLEDVPVSAPAEGELRIRQSAIGVNFHDIYVRSGLYKTLTLPGIPGCEATGVIESTGPGVEGFKVGDLVAYVMGPPYGAYATHRILNAELAVIVPDDLDDMLVAGNLLRALTVEMLLNRVARLEPGMTILVHAAAGGVGRLLCQMAAHMGVTVIGTVGSEEKARVATAAGCHHTILYRSQNFIDEVSRLTKGRGADVVYDSVGADTFPGSLSATAKCGHLVNFGQSSGAVDPVAMTTLAEKSLTVSRPILFHYLQDTQTYRAMATSVFEAFQKGILTAKTAETFPLANAAQAHDRLNSGTMTKPLLLVP